MPTTTKTKTKKEEKAPKKEGITVYEIGFHIVPTVAPEGVEGEVSKLKALIAKHKGIIVSEGKPEMMKLAYEMTKKIGPKRSRYNDAYFGWIKFETSPAEINALKLAIDIEETVLRTLLIETVLENTLYTEKVIVEKVDEKKKDAPKAEAGASTEVELDKTIDELVIE